MTQSDCYTFTFDSIKPNETINLSDYKNSVILLVNTASKCGFTKQYKALESLYQRYKASGLVVIGVPSHDFGNQEFDDACDIQSFTKDTFSVTFPLTRSYAVSGSDAHPVYQWAKTQVSMLGSPKWNFHKYLINRSGKLVDWFSSVTPPDSDKIIQAIEEQLNQ